MRARRDEIETPEALARALRRDPFRTLDVIAARSLVLVPATLTDQCKRVRGQLERLARGQDLLRSREGIRGSGPPPIARKDLRHLRDLADRIARGAAPVSQAAEIADAVDRHKLTLAPEALFERCEADRLALKRALRHRREEGKRVGEGRPVPFHLERGTERCHDCTSPPAPGLRFCEPCLKKRRERKRVKPKGWRW